MSNEQTAPYERAKAYISKMDPAVSGAGGDKQTFKVACKLVEFGLSSSDALSLLTDFNSRCQPPWSEHSLNRKLRAAYNRAAPSSKFLQNDQIKKARAQIQSIPNVPAESPWPKMSAPGRKQIVETTGIALYDLWDLSPHKFDTPHCYDILEYLFPGDPLVCVGQKSSIFDTAPLSSFRTTAHTLQLIVPNPMSAPTGKILDPEPDGPFISAHTLDNTGPRVFAVIECDIGTYDDHASFLWHLSQWAPLILAVHSGGKSLHGWFYVEDQDEPAVRRFYRYAVSLGADYATFTRSQFVRMPDGTRNNGKVQNVVYYNPYHKCLSL